MRSSFVFPIFLFISGVLSASKPKECHQSLLDSNFIFGFTAQLSLLKAIDFIADETAISLIDDKTSYSEESYRIYFVSRLVDFFETYDFQNVPIWIEITPTLSKYLPDEFLERIGFEYDYGWKGTRYWYYPNRDYCSKGTKHFSLHLDLRVDYTTIRIWDDLNKFKGQGIYAISNDSYFGTGLFGVYCYVSETISNSDLGSGLNLYRYYSRSDSTSRIYPHHKTLFIESSSLVIPTGIGTKISNDQTGNLRLRLVSQEEMRYFSQQFD